MTRRREWVGKNGVRVERWTDMPMGQKAVFVIFQGNNIVAKRGSSVAHVKRVSSVSSGVGPAVELAKVIDASVGFHPLSRY